MSIFRIKGTFQMGCVKAGFTKEIIAETEDRARELTYSIIESEYGTKRYLIFVTNTEEILPEEVTDPVVKHMAEEKDPEDV